jgi:hypothetical protein
MRHGRVLPLALLACWPLALVAWFATRAGRGDELCLAWAELLRRACPRCGGPRKLIAAITDGPTARRILERLGFGATGVPSRHSLGRQRTLRTSRPASGIAARVRRARAATGCRRVGARGTVR